jgi:outer membrane protein TolC
LDVARRLNEAGNITDLDLARERALAEAGKLALRSAEIAVRQSREQLNNLMGLWGKNTDWQADGRLPDIQGSRWRQRSRAYCTWADIDLSSPGASSSRVNS